MRAHRDAERTRRYLRTLPDVERNLILQLDGARVLTPLYDGGTPNDR